MHGYQRLPLRDHSPKLSSDDVGPEVVMACTRPFVRQQKRKTLVEKNTGVSGPSLVRSL